MTTSAAERAPGFPEFPAAGMTNGHVLVRPLRESDAQASLELAHDPDNVRWSPYFVARPVDVDDAVARVRRGILQTLEGAAPHLAVENIASCRTALRAGFAQEGVRPSYLPLPDPEDPGGCVRHDTCLHGRLPASAGPVPGEGP